MKSILAGLIALLTMTTAHTDDLISADANLPGCWALARGLHTDPVPPQAQRCLGAIIALRAMARYNDACVREDVTFTELAHVVAA
jgi:hypothetical protein